MAFTKKTWVNVPDPSNPPSIPEGQDSLARFDADNMNRIEEGIDDSVKKSGDTMTGSTLKVNSGTGDFASDEGRVLLRTRKDANSQSWRELILFNDARYDDIKDSLRIGEMPSSDTSTHKWYRVYGEHNKPNANDLGVLSKTIHLTDKDVLSLTEDGWYYCYSAVNVPTALKNGYLRVCVATSLYRVVYWRPANSHTEYVNILSGGDWLGWTEIFTNKGGVLTGNVEISKEDSPYITLRTNNGFSQILKNANDDFDGGIVLKDCSNTEHSSSYMALNIKHSNGKEGGLFLTNSIGGVVSYYNIFGEHNKPRGTYTGNYEAVPDGQTERTISIGSGLGSVLLLLSDENMYLVHNYCALKVGKNSDQASIIRSVRFSSGVLYLDGYEANIYGREYSYQVL